MAKPSLFMRLSWKSAIIPVAALGVTFILIVPYTLTYTEPRSTNDIIAPGVSAHNITAQDVLFLKNSSFQWVRLDNWPDFQSETELLHNSGINVLGILGGAQNIIYNLSTWSDVVHTYAEYYRHTVGAWEIINEPTVSFPSGQPSNMSSEHYFTLQETAYKILKENNTNNLVLGFGGIRILDGTILDIGWVKDLVNEGILDYCDEVSVHLYSSTSNAFITQLNFHKAIKELRNILGDKEIWITEIGQPSDMDPVSFINSVYPMLLSLGIQHIFWYEFRDWVTDFGHHFGLLQTDFTPRPAYYRMLEINREYAVT